MDGPQLVSSDESQLWERPSRGGTAPVDWLRGVFPCFDHLPSFSRYEAAFLRVLCFVIAPSLRDEVTLTGRVFLRPRSKRRLRAPSLGFGAEPSRWGHPYRVVLCIAAHSIGTKAYSIHLSLVASRWGQSTGRMWFFLPLDRNEVFFGWLVGIPSGWGQPLRVRSNNLISSEGITTVGLLRAFFRPVLGVSFSSSFGRPVCSEVGEGSTFSCLRCWQGLCVYPSRQRRSGSWLFFFFWPCCFSPSPGGSVCFGDLAVFHFTWAFHALVLHAWWLASGASGSQTSRNGLLAYYQGASDSLPHPSPGREAKSSVFGIVVRALLQATSLPMAWNPPLRRARDCPSLPLRVATLSLKLSRSEVLGPHVLLSYYVACVISCGPGVLSSFVTLPGLSLWFFRT